nr:unnamed protein product [Digitaria exilis]
MLKKRSKRRARTVVERVRLELLDVGGGAEPPVLVAATAEPYGAAEAGSAEKQQQEQGQRPHHAGCLVRGERETGMGESKVTEPGTVGRTGGLVV